MRQILQLLVTALVHHKHTFENFKTGHIARNISIVRCKQIDDMREMKTVRYARDDNYVVRGVPPHIRQLVKLQRVREQTENMVQNVTKSVMDQVHEYSDQQLIGENLTVEWVKAIVASAALL